MEKENVELFKVLLESQESNYTLLITVLLALTTILAGSSWLWNFFIAKKQIISEIKKQSSALKEEFARKEEELRNLIDEKVEVEVENKFHGIQFDISRLLGFTNQNIKNYDSACQFWTDSLYYALQTNNEVGIRSSLEVIRSVVKLDNFNEYNEDILDLDRLKEVVGSVSGILESEKKEVLKEVQKLKKAD